MILKDYTPKIYKKEEEFFVKHEVQPTQFSYFSLGLIRNFYEFERTFLINSQLVLIFFFQTSNSAENYSMIMNETYGNFKKNLDLFYYIQNFNQNEDISQRFYLNFPFIAIFNQEKKIIEIQLQDYEQLEKILTKIIDSNKITVESLCEVQTEKDSNISGITYSQGFNYNSEDEIFFSFFN